MSGESVWSEAQVVNSPFASAILEVFDPMLDTIWEDMADRDPHTAAYLVYVGGREHGRTYAWAEELGPFLMLHSWTETSQSIPGVISMFDLTGGGSRLEFQYVRARR